MKRLPGERYPGEIGCRFHWLKVRIGIRCKKALEDLKVNTGMEGCRQVNKVIAWHFVGDTLRDGRPVPEDGVTLSHEGKVSICESGFHASRKLLDALNYAPGSTICRVECWGDVVEENDKLVSRHRKILWRVNGEQLLMKFARLHEKYRYDAGSAAGSAARFAARSTALSAARYAAVAAVWYASRSAAARYAARGTDYSTVYRQFLRDANDMLTEMVEKENNR